MTNNTYIYNNQNRKIMFTKSFCWLRFWRRRLRGTSLFGIPVWIFRWYCVIWITHWSWSDCWSDRRCSATLKQRRWRSFWKNLKQKQKKMNTHCCSTVENKGNKALKPSWWFGWIKRIWIKARQKKDNNLILTWSYSLMIVSMTKLWNLMLIIAAIVSSLGRISVGPSTTPRLLSCIKFFLLSLATLKNILIILSCKFYIIFCSRRLLIYKS